MRRIASNHPVERGVLPSRPRGRGGIIEYIVDGPYGERQDVVSRMPSLNHRKNGLWWNRSQQLTDVLVAGDRGVGNRRSVDVRARHAESAIGVVQCSRIR
jgi:hypothetical protein